MPDDVLHIDGSDPGDSLRLMRIPDAWPLGEILPLDNVNEKQPDDSGFYVQGFLVAKPGFSPTRVWMLNIYDRRRYLLLNGIPVEAPYRDYGSMEEVFEAGWRVS